MLKSRVLLCTTLAVTLVSVAPLAQKPGDTPKASDSPAELKALKYRLIGPAAGGRVSRVAGVPGDPLTYYAATASGGVWKSTDGGTTCSSVFDDQPISSIGSIAVAPSNPNVVYVGSGEANIRGNVAAGNGIYKSTDAREDLDPRLEAGRPDRHDGRASANPDIAFAAVLGQAFGPNPERGVYRTNDGGKTWQQVLKKDADTGASDVAMDPSNPNDPVRRALAGAAAPVGPRRAAVPGSGLYTCHATAATRGSSSTGSGLPEGALGQGRRRGRAVRRTSRVYALIEAEKGGLFRSDDGGESWTSGELVAADPPARLVLHDADSQSAEPGRRLVSAGTDAPDDRWRQDASKAVKGAAMAITTTSGSTRRIRSG